MKIVLASSSAYRKQLLGKLLNEFECESPDIDESALPDESPESLAERLAIAKAKALSATYPDALIIGSDQVAWLDDHQLHKPGNRENNIAQLKKASGKHVMFYTSLCLLNTKTGRCQSAVETYTTAFRELSDQQIENYVDKEQGFDCAGGFKMEGLGISLFEKIQGDDPNSLIGLPLIRLVAFLENEGIDILS